MTASAAKGSKSIPVKARPTAEKASTRKVSSVNLTGNKGAVPQTKDLISDADEFAEYNGTSQSFAGYSYKQNEDKFYHGSTEHEDDKSAFSGRNDSSPFKAQLTEKENEDIPEKDSIKKAEKDESQKKEDKSSQSDEPDYKDEIEKEAVEQEKEADRKAEEEEGHNDDDDDDDEDDDSDDDEDDEDEQNNDDDDLKDEGRSVHHNTRQKDDINNPAEQSFAVSPKVLPGMCPPCRK